MTESTRVGTMLLRDGTTGQVAVKDLEEIARDVLSNGLIEDYRVEVLDGTGK